MSAILDNNVSRDFASRRSKDACRVMHLFAIVQIAGQALGAAALVSAQHKHTRENRRGLYARAVDQRDDSYYSPKLSSNTVLIYLKGALPPG